MKTYLGLPTAPAGVGALHGDRPVPVAAREALANTQLRKNLGHATRTIRGKRAAAGNGRSPCRAPTPAGAVGSPR